MSDQESQSAEWYLRTELGEFKVTTREELLKNWLKTNNPELVQTLTGWKCWIKPSDVKIYGLLSDFLKIANDAQAPIEAQTYDSLRFAYSNKSGLVTINLSNTKGNSVSSLEFELNEFVDKVLSELPNAAVDAILEEREKRSYS